ncbi:hypothetical protein F5888DRAFT_1624451 [Russula emetica]|nr:hypothetical protein F5888DRAFT_1624451 [Russula emetica]
MVAHWHTSDEAALIEFLVKHKAQGGDVNFKGVTWTAAATHMIPYTERGDPKTAAVCKNKWTRLKDTYLVVSLLKEQSGFAWDELKGATITVESEPVWRAYVLVRSLLLRLYLQ